MIQFGTIPKVFQRTEGGLLNTCILCNKNLIAPAQDYLIEKAFRVYPEYKKTDVLFEYAICFPCAEAMRNELSTESKQRIEAYFAARVNPQQRLNMLQPKRAPFKQWIAHCLINQTPIKQATEFSMYGHAYGKKLVYDFFPYAISGAVMEEVNELLSAHSRQILDDFIGNHFSGPPEVAEILKRRPVLV